MNPTEIQKDRWLIPRWRPIRSSLRSCELASFRRARAEADADEFFAVAVERYRLDPRLETAAELLEAAVVRSNIVRAEVVEAASGILRRSDDVAPLIVAQAVQYLRVTNHSELIPNALDRSPQEEGSIRRLRQLTRLNPRDALSWVDMSLNQLIAGGIRRSMRSMDVALSINPSNRFVLRSASRLYFHIGDKQRAYDTVARSQLVKVDPWILSAEISFAEAIGHGSKFYKLARNIVSDNSIHPRHLSELFGALATSELTGGNRKVAKRLFNESMIDPTANALAQGEWATTKIGTSIVSPTKLNERNAFEAESYRRYRLFEFERAFDSCTKWARDDAFSVVPLYFGTACAALAENYRASEEMAREALRRLRLQQDHNDAEAEVQLRNAIVFSLASRGMVDDADNEIRRIRATGSHSENVTMANRGLIAMRRGQIEEGRVLYAQSINAFRKAKADRYAASASVYLAREAVEAKLIDARDIVIQASEAIKPFRDAECIPLLQRLQRSVHVPVTSSVILKDIEEPSQPVTKREVKWTTPGLPTKYRA